MRRWWIRCLVLGIGMALGHGQARAQEPLATFGALPTTLPAEGEKKNLPKDHKDHKDQKDHKDHKDGHDGHDGHGDHKHEEPPDLGLRGFLTTGWDEKFEERHREGKAPRFNLFKTRQGFLERVVDFNYIFTSRADRGRFDEHEGSIGIEYAVNRRFELDLEPLYTWKAGRNGRPSQDGLRWDTGARFQLIDTADTAINFQLRVLTPNSRLDERQTTLGFVFAGFNDLTSKGLCRMGLYYHFEYQSLLGPRGEEPEAEGLPPGQRPSGRITYSAALAKTLVEPKVPLFGDFTVFVESFGSTDLNGSRSGQTYFSFTPGVRTNLTGREEKAWWLQTGFEIPVTRQRSNDMGFRISLIRDF